jgi:hypothetical protein
VESDERATAHLIAERTLALSSEDPRPPRRRLAMAVGSSLTVLILVSVGLLYFWPAGRAQKTPPSSAPAISPLPEEEDGGQPGETGTLNCNAWPPATVVIDGKRRGATPLRGVRLRPGTHTLLFTTTDGLLRKELQVTIQPSETRTIAVTLGR